MSLLELVWGDHAEAAMLGLVRLHLNGTDSLARYATALRAWLESHHGTPHTPPSARATTPGGGLPSAVSDHTATVSGRQPRSGRTKMRPEPRPKREDLAPDPDLLERAATVTSLGLVSFPGLSVTSLTWRAIVRWSVRTV